MTEPSWEVRKLLAKEKPFTPQEIAKLFSVDPKTVTRWAAAGKIPSFRTPGGHRRFPVDAIVEYFERTTRSRFPGRPQ